MRLKRLETLFHLEMSLHKLTRNLSVGKFPLNFRFPLKFNSHRRTFEPKQSPSIAPELLVHAPSMEASSGALAALPPLLRGFVRLSK